MKKTIDFVFDFASPNAYLAYQLLPSIAERNGAEITITPCLLGGIFKATGNQPPMIAFGGVQGKLEYEQREISRFVKKHDLQKYQFNTHFPVNTLILMRAAIVAGDEGRLAEYIDAGLVAMWENNKKMDDPEVFVAVMNDAGFDGANLFERTQDPSIKQRLMDNTAQAVRRGAFGVPTFFVGSEMFFGKDRLVQVEEELQLD
ncbi:MAG: 2-hydroxychromene-2-carboxylate isomerase [Pseudomonadales bacterium]|nr:2-hydroxychromene-2-carboxylate isomerase [Pseudomonadales bacterium]MDG2079138.1 2-hydroxychromene-2-carboxylate isomerase [Pseudomonadales bacterium]